MSRLSEIMNKYVVPGDPVCTMEEFLPGSGVYEEGGVIRSSVTGRVQVDLNLRIVNIKPTLKVPQLPGRGDVVYGTLIVLHDELAITKIFANELGIKYHNPFTGLIHISQAADKFIKSFYEILAVGDVVKAKILNNFTPYNLTIKEPKLGVVVAYCSVCGAVLKRHSSEVLKCPKCGNMEKRKLSVDYGNLKGIHT